MANNTEPHPEPVMESAMDYAEHEKTYSGFMAAVKYSIMSMAILVVGLYFAIIGEQPVIGAFLILASIFVPPIVAYVSKK